MAEEMVAGSISAMDVAGGDMGFMATSAVVGICRACGGSAGCLQRHRVVASTTTSSNVMPMNCGVSFVLFILHGTSSLLEKLKQGQFRQ